MATIGKLLVTVDAQTGQFVAEMANAEQAMGRLGAAQGDLKARFQEQFQHIALKEFGADLLRTEGLAGEARLIFTALNLGLTSAAASFGALGTPIALAVVALAAVAGAIYKVIEAREAHAKELDTEIDQLKKVEAETGSYTVLVERYRDTFGTLTPELIKASAAEKDLAASERVLLELKLEEKLEDLNRQLVAQPGFFATAAASAKGLYNSLKDIATGDVDGAVMRQNQAMAASVLAHSKLQAEIAKTEASLTLLRTVGTTDLEGLVSEHEKAAAAAKKQAEELDKVRAAYQTGMQNIQTKERELLDASQADTATSFARKIATAHEAYEKMLDETDKFFNAERLKIGQSDLPFEEQARMIEQLADEQERYRTAVMTAESAKRQAIISQEFGSFDKIASDSAKALLKGFSDAFARMLVEGGNVLNNIKAMLTQVIESAVSAMIQISIMRSMAGGIGGALPGFAEGGDVSAGAPIIVGENGPELFVPNVDGTIVPNDALASAGGGGSAIGSGGGDVSVSVNVDLHVENLDPDKLSDALATQISRKTGEAMRLVRKIAAASTDQTRFAY